HSRRRAARAAPTPFHRARPPLGVGGSGRRLMLHTVAPHADVWSSTAATNEDELAAMRVRAEHCRAIGRDPATIRRCVQIRWGDRKGVPGAVVGDMTADIDAIRDAVDRYVALGFTEIILMVNANDGETTRRLAQVYANDVLPRV